MATNTRSRTVRAAAKADADPLDFPEGHAFLAAELRDAENEVARGPNGEGWRHNESLRPAVNQRAAFLRAVIEKIAPKPKAEA